MADSFIKGADEAGNTAKKIYVEDMDIHGCRGCAACWKTKGNCIFHDDMSKLEPLLEKADVLVISTPLYWSTVPAQMKAPVDRLYQYDPVNGGKHLTIKESVLLATGETEEESDFDMIKNWFEAVCQWNGMEVREMLTVPNVNFKGDINGHEALGKAEALGKSM